jgi:hypothetical protein
MTLYLLWRNGELEYRGTNYHIAEQILPREKPAPKDPLADRVDYAVAQCMDIGAGSWLSYRRNAYLDAENAVCGENPLHMEVTNFDDARRHLLYRLLAPTVIDTLIRALEREGKPGVRSQQGL